MRKGQTVTLTGNTYPYRDQIREIGGRWDAARKVWVVEAGTMRERAQQSAVICELRRHGVREA